MRLPEVRNTASVVRGDTSALGVLFHYFHDANHRPSQGSIDATEFVRQVEYLGRDRFVDARDFFELARTDRLSANQLCITLDDGLASQRDVALPVLDELDLTAFWFVNTAMYGDRPPTLELYRAFRSEAYASVDAFYDDFEGELGSRFPSRLERAESEFAISRYLSEFTFYSDRDRWFRFVRDLILTSSEYQDVMASLMARSRFRAHDAVSRLWLTEHDLRRLDADGHIIGLHSHSHPLRMDRLPVEEQRHEYEQNAAILTEILSRRPYAASHPGGWYTRDTLRILEDLGIEIAFRADSALPPSHLELPRKDSGDMRCRDAP
jgi:peptidoglycan/xylan/chitin deacetylase (PgdA/CDA1 family)